jgi:hypothetical protein
VKENLFVQLLSCSNRDQQRGGHTKPDETVVRFEATAECGGAMKFNKESMKSGKAFRSFFPAFLIQ